MKILSYRRQVIADHSSTSYLFYSPKRLTKAATAVVSELSSHVDVGEHTAEITYHGDFADLGDARRKKFLEYYDVEVRESYDWWDITVMLETEKLPDLKAVTQHEEADGESALAFDERGKRLCIQFSSFHLDYDACYGTFGENVMAGLAKLALDIRKEMYAGRSDALTVMAAYCRGDELPSSSKLSSAAITLCAILERI